MPYYRRHGDTMCEEANAADDARRSDKTRTRARRLVRAYLARGRNALAVVQAAKVRRREVYLATDGAAQVSHFDTAGGGRAKGRHADTTATAAERRARADLDVIAAQTFCAGEMRAVMALCDYLPLFEPGRALVEYTHIDGESVERAAATMGYSRAAAFKLIAEAVDMLVDCPPAWRMVCEWREATRPRKEVLPVDGKLPEV